MDTSESCIDFIIEGCDGQGLGGDPDRHTNQANGHVVC